MQNLSPSYGSHLPAVMMAVNKTDGPILELGMGLFSTPYLHFACYPNRRLVSYDNDSEYYNLLQVFENDYHEICLVEDWDKINISRHWSVALVDHEPTSRRKVEIQRLVNFADYIVVHDTNPRLDAKYKYSAIYPLFKYRRDFNQKKPRTAILSNFYDPSKL
jgi:hypothetical protein